MNNLIYHISKFKPYFEDDKEAENDNKKNENYDKETAKNKNYSGKAE